MFSQELVVDFLQDGDHPVIVSLLYSLFAH